MNKAKFKDTEIGRIPEDWDIKSINEISNISIGGTPKTSVQEFWDGKIKWASARDVTNAKSRYIYETERSITEKGIENSAAKVMPRNTIVITSRGTVGEIAMLSEPMSYNQTCYGLIAKHVDDIFLYYSLRNIIEHLKNVSYGTVFNTITTRTFDEVKIAIPSNKLEQSAIAKILSDLDSKIELNQQMNKTLEAIGQAIFKQWFVDFEFPNEDGKPYKSSGGEMVDSELGKIPKGWKAGQVGDLVEFAYGKGLIEKERKKGMYPVVGSSGIIDYHNEYFVKGPGIVIGRKGTIGNVTWIDEDFFPIDTTFYIISKLNEKRLYFFYYLLVMQEFNQMNSDSAVPGLNRNRACDTFVVVSPVNIITMFNNICSSLFNQKTVLKKEISTLSQIRDSLLPKLMSGKIRIGEV